MDTRLCTPRTLAERLKRLGLSRAWLRAETEAGRIPCFRAGRKLLFDAQTVEEALLIRAGQAPTKGGGRD